MSTVRTPVLEGKALLEALEVEKATHHFTQLLRQPEYALDAKVWLGRIDMMQYNTQKGLDRLEEVLQESPEHAEALSLKAVVHIQEERYEEARDLLERAQQSDPELAMTYGNLAIVYRELDELDKALAAAEQGILLEPENYNVRYERSHILAFQDEIEEAIHELLRVLDLNPHHIIAYLTLGTLYKQAEEFEIVAELYEEGLRINPGAYVIREDLIALYTVLQQAEKAMEHALFLAEERGSYMDHILVGNTALLLGKPDVAEESYKTATTVEPKAWEPHFNLGELYQALELYEQAKEEYQESIRCDKLQYKPYNGIAQTLLQENNAEEAQAYLVYALELGEGKVEPIHNMALCCTLLEKYADARSFSEVVQQMAPEGSPIHEESVRLINELDILERGDA